MKYLIFLLYLTLFCIPIGRADEPYLDGHLKPLENFLNKTWKGQFKESTAEKPMFDIAAGASEDGDLLPSNFRDAYGMTALTILPVLMDSLCCPSAGAFEQ